MTSSCFVKETPELKGILYEIGFPQGPRLFQCDYLKAQFKGRAKIKARRVEAQTRVNRRCCSSQLVKNKLLKITEGPNAFPTQTRGLEQNKRGNEALVIKTRVLRAPSCFPHGQQLMCRESILQSITVCPRGGLPSCWGQKQLTEQHLHKFAAPQSCPGYLKMVFCLPAHCPLVPEPSVPLLQEAAVLIGKMMRRRLKSSARNQ